ncbi:Pancreatic triacylglycerol lipase [Araneus ventricosus]|uniref:Pancreatic triacylglycerol lipase n=1 Tax=Araneus ventricosus TaxID=182803 RepID=A0A4Y2C0W0_ARAVE|nr:Pancreatic triacylglycerol lipase [Araneus ventricosus]
MHPLLYICLFLGFQHVRPFTLETNLSSNVTSLDHEPTVIQEQEYQHASIGSKRCMRDLGCFEITVDFFHSVYRPVNFLPHDRSTINTKFFLYSKEQPKEYDEIHPSDPEDIKDSHLNPDHRTVFIVHGFIDSRFYGKWMEEVKDNLLLHNNYNVIIVDWSGGNGAPYTQATANTRVVGAEIALLIQKLQKLKGVSPMNCHIIGHSLGAHVAGYAGLRLNKLGRITGLDPAQPYFQYMPPSVRLDQTDADFVDVIHTDSGSYKFLPLGMSQSVGHVDFYPNNGLSQPGCTYSTIHSILLEGLVDAARRFVSCNHQRAVDFFTYSINYKKALPVAYHCTTWEDYISGFCADCGKNDTRCAILGMQAEQYKPNKNDSRSVKMYLATSSSAPFWEYSYQIQVKLQKPQASYSDNAGQIQLKIQGTKNIYDLQLSPKTGNLIHGATYTFLVREQKYLGKLTSIIFSWSTSSWNFFKTHTIHLDYVKISPMNVNNQKKQKMETKKFCHKLGQAIKSKQEVFLDECT